MSSDGNRCGPPPTVFNVSFRPSVRDGHFLFARVPPVTLARCLPRIREEWPIRLFNFFFFCPRMIFLHKYDLFFFFLFFPPPPPPPTTVFRRRNARAERTPYASDAGRPVRTRTSPHGFYFYFARTVFRLFERHSTHVSSDGGGTVGPYATNGVRRPRGRKTEFSLSFFFLPLVTRPFFFFFWPAELPISRVRHVTISNLIPNKREYGEYHT